MTTKTFQETKRQTTLVSNVKQMTFLLSLLFAPLFNYGQTTSQILTGRFDAGFNRGYGFSCNVQVEITKSISGNKLVFKSKLLSVQIADNKGWYDNARAKYYSCDVIGNYCVIFPQFLYVKTEYGNFPFDSPTFSFVGQEIVIYDSYTDIFKSVVGADASTFKVPSISQVIITHQGDAPIWNKLKSIWETETSNNNSSSGTTNPLSGTSSNSNSNSSTINQTLNNYDPNTGLYSNPLGNSSTTASNDKFTQNVQNATNVINGLAQLFTPSQEEIERRQAQEELIQNKTFQARAQRQEKAEMFYKENYLLPLIDLAQSGDENARITLCSKLIVVEAMYTGVIYNNEYFKCDLKHLLPNRIEWLAEAVKNNNTEAMILQHRLGKPSTSYLSSLDSAAKLGSLDAMISLAKHYNGTKKLYGGENPELALKWFVEAAKKGCPMANYYLGTIYLQGQTTSYPKGFFVKYKIEKDYQKAFYFFKQSEANANRQCSGYAKDQEYITIKIKGFSYDEVYGSVFVPKTYYYLALLYENGIEGGIKNPEKAKEYSMYYEQSKNK